MTPSDETEYVEPADEWADIEQEWLDLVRVVSAAELAYQRSLKAKADLEKALDALERARARVEKARAQVMDTCDVAEEWIRFAAGCRDASGVM